MPYKPGVSPATAHGQGGSGNTTLVLQAASLVGLLGTPQGEGPFLAFSAHLANQTKSASVIVDTAPPVAPVTLNPNHWNSNDFHASPMNFVMPLALAFGAIVAVIAVIIRLSMAAQVSGGRIRIVAVPPGEAPEDVRQAWVGLELPLAAGERGPSTGSVVGVVSKNVQSPMPGYAVDGRIAVESLASAAPEAAQWWRENAAHVLAAGYQLVFPVEVCERTD